MQRGEDDGSEQPSSSNPGQSLYFKRMITEEIERKLNILRREIPVIVIKTIQQEINPAVIEGSLRKVVQEEIQKHLPQRTRNDVPEERSLHLLFLDEVSSPVLTSKEFKGMKDGPLKVALFDATGNPVTSGPESSAEVEILLIDDNERNTMGEDFEKRIIRAGDKGKPHFAKNVYAKLFKGEAALINQKLGQDKDWTKTWTCRLGARFVEDFKGLKVQNAWTEPFEVKDNRGDLYKKLESPLLTSEVRSLKGIGRNGEPLKRLEAANIKTVLDFLFWHSVNPKELQKILDGGKKAGKNRWNTIVNHAMTCIIDDKRLYCLKSCTEPRMAVVYDIVGELKGVVIDESHFVPIDNMSADEKEHALELLSKVLDPAAFVDRYKTFFNDESSLLQQYPHKSSAPTNCTIQQQCLNPNDPACSSQSIFPAILDPENIGGDIPTDLGTSSLVAQTTGCENAGDSDDWRHFVRSHSNTFIMEMVDELMQGWSTSHNPGTASLHDVQTNAYQNGDNRNSQQTPRHASRRWTKLYYVLMVSINVNYPKLKKQRVG